MPAPGIWVEIEEFLRTGGYVMIPLAAVSLLLWFLLGMRMVILRRGFRGNLAEALQKTLDGEKIGQGIVGTALSEGTAAVHRFGEEAGDVLDEVVIEQEQRLTRFAREVKVLVAAAPLLGLLGTVSGMIETFASLTDMALFAESGGVAGGISEALVTTQVGLFVAIPGMLVGRLLDRRASRLGNDLQKIKNMLAVQAAA